MRCIPTSKTLALISPYSNKIGIERVSDVTDLDNLSIPTVSVVRPDALSVTTSLGKGLTMEMATVSALMECHETHAAEICSPETISESMYRRSRGYLQNNYRMFYAESLFHSQPGEHTIESLTHEWNVGINLESTERVPVPHQCVHLRPVFSQINDPLPIRSSNGLASGNSRDEAILHAVLEVIERDAVTLFNRLAIPEQMQSQVSEDTCSDEMRKLINSVKQSGLRPILFDITTNIDVPVMYGVIIDPNHGIPWHMHMVSGSACDVDPNIAALGAITEAAQARVALIMASREDFDPNWLKSELTADYVGSTDMIQFYLNSKPTMVMRSATDVGTTVLDQLDIVKSALKRLEPKYGEHWGQIIAVDINDSDSFPAVVKVFVTGVEHPHDDATYVPGPRALEQSGLLNL